MAFTTTLRGASGAQYEFWNVGLGDVLPPVGGVYALSRAPRGLASFLMGHETEVLYVGKAQDLSERVYTGLRNHHKWASFHAAGAQYVGVHLITSEAERARIEADLIHGLSPVFNETLNALSAFLK